MVALTRSLLVVVSVFFAILTVGLHDRIDLRVAHNGLLLIALVVVVAVVFTAHITLRHLLGPLRSLSDGVTRLGAGELDVHLARTTHDEFGHLTDAFNQMAARVRAMVAARDRLLADVSHELRSPLTRMKVAVELLPDAGPARG
jgi:signal transduction histidine kinase